MLLQSHAEQNFPPNIQWQWFFFFSLVNKKLTKILIFLIVAFSLWVFYLVDPELEKKANYLNTSFVLERKKQDSWVFHSSNMFEKYSPHYKKYII